MSMDPIKIEVFKNIFASVAEEMGVILNRTAFSPNIKERRDYSCAIFDHKAVMLAQAAHIPVHLGSTPLSVRAAIERKDPQDGDMVILNDPFAGGTHLPDITLVAPVSRKGKILFYVANRAHHADVGGAAPGSMSLTSEIFQEGLRIPPVFLVKQGKVQEHILDVILTNVRTPKERRGDLNAQIAAIRMGIRRMEEILDRYGKKEVLSCGEGLLLYTERIMKRFLRTLPDGSFSFRDSLDDDGMGTGPLPIQVKITVRGAKARVDFTGTHPQVEGSVNANFAVTLSGVFYVLRSLLDQDVPTNWGLMAPITLIAPEGSLVNAQFPASVAGGNVETSQRIVDVLLGALGTALPGRIPAASAGTMNNLTIGGFDPVTKSPFTYYETIGGGMGARPDCEGESGIHTHMTNTLNTPIEALERAYPLRVHSYTLRKGSGGKGKHRGGEGITREIEVLCPASMSLLADRREISPYGLKKGSPGKVGVDSLLRKGRRKKLPSKVSIDLEAGDIISIKTPGGGGFGKKK